MLRHDERWLQAQILRPRGRASHVVRPSATLSARERVDIYARMVFARQLECLGQDYRALRALLGERAFERVVRAYLRKHPSRHPSLNLLGRRLPRFLSLLPRRALAADVAAIEGAMSEVFDAPEEEALGSAQLAAVPERDWERSRLRPIRALRLLALAHPADGIVRAARQGKPLPRAARRKTWVVVWRRDDVVWRAEVRRAHFVLLDALARGRTVGQALARAAGCGARPSEVFAWFRAGTADGMFGAVQRPQRAASRR